MTETLQGHGLFYQARQRIQRGIIERGIPSLAIAVAQGNSVLWEEGFGWADRERSIAATPPYTLFVGLYLEAYYRNSSDDPQGTRTAQP